MVLAVSPLVLCGPRIFDCTETFKDRVASFEYNYFPGYWLAPYTTLELGWSSTSEVKTNNIFQWILHDCGDSVCMESKKPGWKDYFAAGLGLHVDTDLSDGSDETIHWRILCDSCNPSGSENTTFSNCQMNWQGREPEKKLYSGRHGVLWECSDCGNDSWFRWRIESPPTRVYWKVVLSHCNRGNTNDTVKYTVKTSITTSKSTTSTVSVNAKISAGLGAGKLLQSSGGELGASFTWSRTYLEQLAREKTVETSTEVEPGMKWVVSQAVGEADWTSIATDRTKTEKIPCWSTTTTTTTAATAAKNETNNATFGFTLIQLIIVLNLLYLLI